MTQCWVYHAENEPMIVDADKAQDYYDDGWKDSPASFIKTTDFGIEPEDEIGVQQIGETIEGIKDQLNGALNLSEMSHKDLDAYALEHFGLEFKKQTLSQKIEEIEAQING